MALAGGATGAVGCGDAAERARPADEAMPAPAPRGPVRSRAAYAARVTEAICSTVNRIEEPDLRGVERSEALRRRAAESFADVGDELRRVVAKLGELRTEPAYRAEAEQLTRALWEMSGIYFEVAKAVHRLDGDAVRELRKQATVNESALESALRGFGFDGCD